MDILGWVKRQTGKIADNVKDYRFYVKNQPDNIDSSSTLVLTAFTNRDEIATIPCVYKWSRIRNGLATEASQFKGNSFICEPSDVGSIIQAEVTSTDMHHKGTAILQYGPVKLDILLKKQIEHALGVGSALLNVDLVQKNEAKQCQVKIMDDKIRISHSHSHHQYTFDYSIGQPRIEASPKQPHKVIITFGERHEFQVVQFIKNIFGNEDMSASQRQRNQHKLELKFSNRNIRDNFLFIIKAFNTKRVMKNATVISKIQQLDFNDSATFDYVLEIDSLKMDLLKLSKLNQKYLLDKKRYFDEARKYEKQIEETIITYTKIAENKWKTTNELDESVMELRERKDQVMERKIQNLIRENEVLQDRVSFLTNELNNFYPQKQQKNQESQQINPTEIPRGGFIKKKQAYNFDQILNDLNESQVKEPTPVELEVKELAEEKKFLARKLNESVQKIASLESKIKKIQHNNSAINIGGEKERFEKANLTTVHMSENKKNERNEEEGVENKRLRSDIPMISSKTELYKIQVFDEHSRSKKKSENPEEILLLYKKIQQLTKQNQQLKKEIQILCLQKQTMSREKSSLEAKYRKKMEEMNHQIGMYKKNQDALNRSQHLSMEMEEYNEEQNSLLKEQNNILVSENQKLLKLVERYLKEAKEVPKLKEEILELKKNGVKSPGQ